jgi:hypothetical protein
VAAQADLAALVERVRLASAALAELADAASAVGPDLVDTIRVTRDEVERCLASGELMVAIAGEPGAKRSFLNAILGARAFEPTGRTAHDIVLTLRPARAYDYTARLRDGTVVDFALRMPDREESSRRPAPALNKNRRPQRRPCATSPRASERPNAKRPTGSRSSPTQTVRLAPCPPFEGHGGG